MNYMGHHARFSLGGGGSHLRLLRNLRGVLLSVSGTVGVIHRARRRTRIIPGLVVNFVVSRVRTRCITRVGLHRLGHRCVLGHAESVTGLVGRVTRLRRVLNDRHGIGLVVVSRLGTMTRGCKRPQGARIVCVSSRPMISARIRVPSCTYGLFLAGRNCFGGVAPRSLHVSNSRGLGRNSYVMGRVRASGQTRLLFFASRNGYCGSETSTFNSSGGSILKSFVPMTLGFSRNRGIVNVMIAGSCSNRVLFMFGGNGMTGIPIDSCRAGAGHGVLRGTCSVGSPLIRLLSMNRGNSMVLHSAGNEYVLFGANVVLPGAAQSARNIRTVALGTGDRISATRLVATRGTGRLSGCHAGALPTTNPFTGSVRSPSRCAFWCGGGRSRVKTLFL